MRFIDTGGCSADVYSEYYLRLYAIPKSQMYSLFGVSPEPKKPLKSEREKVQFT
jgi:hypothetical protein